MVGELALRLPQFESGPQGRITPYLTFHKNTVLCEQDAIAFYFFSRLRCVDMNEHSVFANMKSGLTFAQVANVVSRMVSRPYSRGSSQMVTTKPLPMILGSIPWVPAPITTS